MRRIALAAALLLPSLLLAQDGFRALGEIQTADSSAAFDANSVRGPQVQVTREGKDQWRGWVRGMAIDGTERKNGLRGANFALYVERVKGGVQVRGNLDTRTVNIHIPDDPQQRFHRRLTLKGLADTEQPPAAQFALAAVAAIGP